MTAQEIFDKVSAHLLEQKFAAVGAHGSCRYRGRNGTSCAVGCLIPDEHYIEDMEGYSVNAVIEQCPPERAALMASVLKASGIERADFKLLLDLQFVHDSIMLRPFVRDIVSAELWQQRVDLNQARVKEALRFVAETHNLVCAFEKNDVHFEFVKARWETR